MKFGISKILVFTLIAAGVLSLSWWLLANPVAYFSTSEPGQDNRGETVKVMQEIHIGEFFEEFEDEKTDEFEEIWPRFRGEYFDNISRSPIKLMEKFPENGPDINWSVSLGEGHAGPAIYKGKVYLMDYDEEIRADMLRCFSLEKGTELWRRGYKVPVKRNHGMSRTVPAVTNDFILTIGPRSHVMCLSREKGEFLWGLDVEKEYATEVPFWYTGQCPLIDEGKAIIATGGRALLIALDCKTGELLWESPNPDGWMMSHSSIMPYTFEGVKMYVYSAVGGACGIAADGADAGRVIWKTARWNHQVVAPSPVCLPNGKIFLSAGYGAGSMVLQLKRNASGFVAEVIQEYKPREGLSSEQQTPVVYQGHLIGILPKDAAAMRNQMICIHPGDFTNPVWTSGPTARFGLGPYIIADNKMYILSDDGTLTIVKPSLDSYIESDRFRVIEGQDAWAPIAIADGYMVLRDSETMICLDMAKSR